jgi:translocation and assembly module TamB
VKPRARRLLRAIVVGLVLPIVIGPLVVWWVIGTSSGTRWAVGRLSVLMKGSVKVGSVEGRIVSPLTLHDLKWESASLAVVVRKLTLGWSLGKLLRRQLDIGSLVAEGVTVVSKPSGEDKSKGLTDLHLPVNILVRDASVREIRLGAGPKTALVVDSIGLKTTAIQDTLRVESLSIRSALFDGDFNGTLTPIGDYPVGLQMRWAYRPPGSSAYEGNGSFTGNLKRLEVKEHLTAPFAARIDAILTEPLRDLKFDATVSVTDLGTRAIDKEWPDARISGSGRARGTFERLSAEANLQTTSAMLGRADVALALERAGGDYTLKNVRLTFPGRPTSIEAKGKVTLPPNAKVEAMALDLTASWKQLTWPLQGKPIARSRTGEAHVRGRLDDYALDLNADLEAQGAPPGKWTLRGKGDRERLELASLEADVLSGRVAGSGVVAWAPEIGWSLTLTGRDIDPQQLAKGYAGKLAFEAFTRGKLPKRGGPIAHVELRRLDGTLRGQPLSASATADMEGETIRVEKLEVTSGSSRLAAHGVVGPASDLMWSLEAPNLASLMTGAAGSLAGHGRIAGPRSTPRVVASLRGKGLSFGDKRAATLEVEADVSLAQGAPLSLDVKATGVAVGARTIDSATITGRGTRDRHTISVTAEGKDPRRNQSLRLEVAGGLDAKLTWRGEIRRLDAESKEIGAWKLESPAALELGSDHASLEHFCWTSQGGRLCLSGKYGGGAWQGSATVHDVPLALFGPLLPADVEISGALNGSVNAKGFADGRLEAKGELVPGPGEIRYPEERGGKGSVRFHDAALRLSADASGLTAHAGVVLEGTGTASFDLSLPEYNARGVPQKNQPVKGRVQIEVTRLDVVQGFVEGVREVRGALHADLTLGDTLGAPSVLGEAQLDGGQADLPDYGIQLREISVVARGDGTGPLRFEGKVRSGPGRLTITGDTPVTPGALTSTHVRIEGDQFLVLDQPPDNRVLVSPRVAVTLKGKRLDVNGDLEIPEAKYVYLTRFAAVPVSRDVVIIGAPDSQPKETGWELGARLRLILGEKVRIKGSGIDARVTGSVLAIEQPGRDVVATGELELHEGTYKAYGQDLTIERGRLFFAGGPIDNPGIDVRVYRKAKDGVVAGLEIKGTLKAPEVTIWSQPSMAQSEALAYVLLGHPLGKSTQQEGSLVANAAASLGLKGGNLLAKKLAAKFGLEETRIETEGSFSEAALVVGKFLSPRLYVQYGIGLFTRVSTLRVSYILNKRWTVRAETGVENAADIVYTIEK